MPFVKLLQLYLLSIGAAKLLEAQNRPTFACPHAMVGRDYGHLTCLQAPIPVYSTVNLAGTFDDIIAVGQTIR